MMLCGTHWGARQLFAGQSGGAFGPVAFGPVAFGPVAFGPTASSSTQSLATIEPLLSDPFLAQRPRAVQSHSSPHPPTSNSFLPTAITSFKRSITHLLVKIMEGCAATFRALRLRLPPCAANDVIEDELALDICSATKAKVFLHSVYGPSDAIVPAMDAVAIGDNYALPAFMAQMNWRASGLRLMVGPRTEPPGSNWIGLEVEQLTCDVDDLTDHVQFSHAHITIGTYTEGRRFQQRVRS